MAEKIRTLALTLAALLCGGLAFAQVDYRPPSGGGTGSGNCDPAQWSSPDGTVTVGGSSGACTLSAGSGLYTSFVTGTSDPATCTVGSIFNLRTDSTLLKVCSATNTWKQLAWSDQATDTFGALTDVTTNNASTSAHGFLKKLDNNAAHYMDGTGAWSTPGGGAFLLNASGGASAPTVTASTTNYFFPWGGTSGNASESVRSIALSATCTLSNFYVTTQSTQSATGDLVFTVRANGSDTALVVTVAAGSAAGVFSDTTHTGSVTAGQTVSVKVANAATATSTPINGWSLKCTP